MENPTAKYTEGQARNEIIENDQIPAREKCMKN